MAKEFVVETSARHTHLSAADLEKLFGKGAQLHSKKALSQPGQFACEEKITVVGPKGELTMSVLGPTRNETQVEISLSDARSIGVTAPIRESGDLVGSAPCIIKGPKGQVELKQGVIVAKRHIHATPADAAELGVKDKDIVAVEVVSNGRNIILGDTIVRVSPKYALAMHVDTDEANAGAFSGTVHGKIVNVKF